MKDITPKRQREAPLSVRYTLEQFALLDSLRGKLSRSAYVKWTTLGGEQPAITSRTVSKAFIRDHQLISKVLGLLGQSRIANNVNQLAKAVNTGSLSVVGGWGDRQNTADRLDPIRRSMIVNKRDHDLNRRSSSAWAK